MKSLTFALLFIFSSFSLMSQSCKSDCSWLQKSLQDSVINQGFLLDRFPNQTLVIIDTSNIFSTCTLQNIYNRKIEVRHTLSPQKEKHEIMVFCVSKDRKKTVFAFFYPINKMYMEVELIKKRRRIKTKVVKGGFLQIG